MRTLLRRTKTGDFFQSPESWTEHKELAYDFHFADRAMSYAATWELNDVELAFTFENSEAIATAPLHQQIAA